MIGIRRNALAFRDTLRYYRSLSAAANLSTANQTKCLVRESRDNENSSIKPNPRFVNRNPRNLERLCFKPKDYGWGMEWEGYAKSKSSNLPRKNYYYKLDLWETKFHTYAQVQHYSGATVVEASTREQCIRRHLYSSVDVMAAANLGKIIAERCLRAGISCVSFRFPDGLKGDSEKIQRFQAGAEEGGLVLEEPDHRRFDYVKRHEVPKGVKPPELD